MSTVVALASIVLKEMLRRKDFYVLFVMTALLTLLLGSVHCFKDARIAGYLKEICLLLIWISALVIAITTAARQIPAERENRTIFPLLAKPVTRAQVVIGKFLGCWLATGAALLTFYVFLFVISGSREGQWPVATYVQAWGLQWVMLAVVIALVLLGSVTLSAPSSNITISFVVVTGVLLLVGHLNTVALQQPEPVRSITYTIYFLLPHLEWYDIRDFVIHNLPVVPWLYCGLATAYAAAYTALLLLITWLVFRRKELTA